MLCGLLVLLHPSPGEEQVRQHPGASGVLLVQDQLHGTKRRIRANIRDSHGVTEAVMRAFPHADRSSINLDCGGLDQNRGGLVRRVCIEPHSWESAFMELRDVVCRGWRRLSSAPSPASHSGEYQSAMHAG